MLGLMGGEIVSVKTYRAIYDESAQEQFGNDVIIDGIHKLSDIEDGQHEEPQQKHSSEPGGTVTIRRIFCQLLPSFAPRNENQIDHLIHSCYGKSQKLAN